MDSRFVEKIEKEKNKISEDIMSIWQILTNHKHYWGVPHKIADDMSEIVMICYDCGKVRNVKADIEPHN